MAREEGGRDERNTAATLVDALYYDFFLRVLLAGIVPGSILLLAVLHAASGRIEMKEFTELPLAAWVLFLWVAWLAGIAIQALGGQGANRTGRLLVRDHPSAYDESTKRHDLCIQFSRSASPREIRQVDRYALIKEASGTAATLLVLVFAIMVFADRAFWTLPVRRILAILVGGGALFFALLSANRSHAEKQYAYMERVVDLTQGTAAREV